MKKILFFALGLITVNTAFGQVIDSQNFNSLTAGNVGTNFTGASAGQGGYYLINGAASDYQIVTIDAAHANSIRITAGSGYTATNDPNNHTVAKPVGVNANAGNNIIKATYSFYTGSANGTGSIYFNLLDDGTTPGVIVSLIYNVATKTITAGGAVTNNGTRVFAGIKTLGATYPANTWVPLGMAYNMTTGAMTWYTPQETYTFSTPPAGYALIPGLDVGQYRTYNLNASGNSAAYTWAFDDFNMSYSNNIVLAANEVTKEKNSDVQIYPNPATDHLTVKSASKISKVEIFDMSGKNVGSGLSGDKVDVSALTSGTYLINIETKEGKTSKKFIKK
ncbi:T9SS type A sorting domain-containing protein [uncultured Chryseobacterium sp.]|uniref:T9SS type A sorting domain-containing protein n=1 Tax=uncultured Chryseobacterium sp. TaxID=259322 RepID=UPI0025EBD8E5|nr:T9SS type A sorting domain-containing protein [uncultured Chryseobacterium sp.]